MGLISLIEKHFGRQAIWKFKLLIAWALFICYQPESKAQVTATSDTFKTKYDDGETVEYVTVGSIMPYKVAPFNWGVLAQFMNPSIFKWWLNGNATGYHLLKSDGITPLTP